MMIVNMFIVQAGHLRGSEGLHQIFVEKKVRKPKFNFVLGLFYDKLWKNMF